MRYLSGGVVKQLTATCAAVLSAVTLMLTNSSLAYASSRNASCFRACIGQVIVSVEGDSDYLTEVGGIIQIVSPPFISNPRINVQFIDYSGQVKLDKWRNFTTAVNGTQEMSWKVGARFGPGKVCATGYEGANQLATACTKVLQ